MIVTVFLLVFLLEITQFFLFFSLVVIFIVRRRRTSSDKKVSTFNGQHVNPTFNANGGLEDPYSRLPFQDDGVINSNNDDEYNIPENNIHKYGKNSTKRLITNDYDTRPYVSSSLTRPAKPSSSTSKKDAPPTVDVEANIYSPSYDSEQQFNSPSKENQGFEANTYSTIGGELNDYASVDDVGKKLRVDMQKPDVGVQRTRAVDNEYETTGGPNTKTIQPQRKAPPVPDRKDLTSRQESGDDSNNYDTTKRSDVQIPTDDLYDTTNRSAPRPRVQSRSGVPRTDANQYETVSSRGFRNPGYEPTPVPNDSPYDRLER